MREKDGVAENVRNTEIQREKDRSMLTDTQVDLFSKLSTMPGNGMTVDCRGFDRGIWLV